MAASVGGLDAFACFSWGTIKAGASEAAAMQEVTLPQYAHVQRYKEWKPLDVRAAYRYLRGV